MTLSESTLTALKELAKTNPQVKELLDFYEFVTTNRGYESYVARVVTIDQWNKDLTGKPVSILSSKKDGEDDKGKEIDRILKYLREQNDFLETTDKIRNKLTANELDLLKTDKRVKESSDIAFG